MKRLISICIISSIIICVIILISMFSSMHLDNSRRFELALDFHSSLNNQNIYFATIFIRPPKGVYCANLCFRSEIERELFDSAKYHIKITDIIDNLVVFDKVGMCSDISDIQNNQNFLVIKEIDYESSYKILIKIEAPKISPKDISLIKFKIFSYADLYKQNAGRLIPWN